MFENLYTTKMSMDKEKLQSRFEKIRSKNGKWSKTVSVIIFVIVMIIIGTISVYLAVKQSDENPYAMSEADFREYTSRPIGALMADIDYADDEKVVFHYINGFFITNEKTKEIEHKIDLSKLNSALPVQADTTLMIRIDKNGDRAFLESQGVMSEAEQFDKYIIDLNTGKVEIGEMPKNIELFGGYIDADSVKMIEGWNSMRAIKTDSTTYYFSLPYGTIGNIRLVKIKGDADEEVRYVFGDEYINSTAKHEKLIHSKLAEGEVIMTNSGMSRQADGEKARAVIDKLSSIMQMKYIEIKEGNYEVVTYDTLLNKTVSPRIYIIDNDNMEIVFSVRLNLTYGNGLHEFYAELNNLLEDIDKDFEMQDFDDMKQISLIIGNGRYSPQSPEAMAEVEKMLSSAKPIKGGTKCPFRAKLVIVNKNGQKSSIDLAADSCAVFKSGNSYYDYSEGDNSKFYSLFGVDSKYLPDLFR